MKLRTELAYLSELHIAANMLVHHGDVLASARDRWLAANEEVEARLNCRPPVEGTASAIVDRTVAQKDLWFSLEAFLGAWARASLLLFPVRKSSADRGEYLQKTLAISSDHLLSNRDLRNSWMHYDERLDDAIGAHAGITPQVFSASPEQGGPLAVREIIMKPLAVAFFGESAVNLEDMIDAGRALLRQVNAASATLPERHLSELDGS